MTSDQELRARLQGIDPMRADAGVDSLRSSSTDEIKERIMQTINQLEAPRSRTRAHWHRWQVLSAAAAAALLLVVSVAVAGSLTGGDTGGGKGAADPTTLALKVPSSSVMASCVGFQVEYLRDMPVAFAGTATSVDSDAVTLKVDRWYKGGTADQATVSRPDPQSSIALDGVEFVEGKRYLVTATDGTVNGCGFSGEATPELEKAFAEAFPS